MRCVITDDERREEQGGLVHTVRREGLQRSVLITQGICVPMLSGSGWFRLQQMVSNNRDAAPAPPSPYPSTPAGTSPPVSLPTGQDDRDPGDPTRPVRNLSLRPCFLPTKARRRVLVRFSHYQRFRRPGQLTEAASGSRHLRDHQFRRGMARLPQLREFCGNSISRWARSG